MRIHVLSADDIRKVMGSCGTFYITKYLAEGNDVDLIIPKRDYPVEPIKTKNHRLSIPGIPFAGFFIFNLRALARLGSLILARTDIVYTDRSTMISGWVAKRLWKALWVCDFRAAPTSQEKDFLKHSGKRSLSRAVRTLLLYVQDRLLHKALRHCDLALSISEEVKQELSAYGIVPDRVHVQGSGVDTHVFKPPKKRPPGFNVVCVSTISAFRGVETCVYGLNRIADRIPEARLILAGSGPAKDMDKLRVLVSSLGLTERVDVKGFVPHSQIPALLDSAHVAISPVPALDAYQVSSPEKVFEYMAAGLPVIATDIRAHRKVIEPGKNGLLFRPQDPKGLADNLIRLHNNKTLSSRLSKASLKTAEAYDWESNVRLIEERMRGL